MIEAELLENKEKREEMIDRIDILDRVGTLLLLPSTNMATRQQVADYYGVQEGAIRQIETRHCNEIESDGFRLYSRKEIENFIKNNSSIKFERNPKYIKIFTEKEVIKISNRGAYLYTKEAILKIAMFLQDSFVANKIKQELSNNKKGFVYIRRKELYFLDKLEESLKPFNITGERQYSILNYRIDYYIKDLNVAIEYDENEHRDYTYEEQELRQVLIEKELGCNFIRVSDKYSDEYNIGLTIKKIFNINNENF